MQSWKKLCKKGFLELQLFKMESEVESTDNPKTKYNLHPIVASMVKLSQFEHRQSDRANDIMQELGLTYSEAKLYMALARLSHPSTVNALSQSSNTARQDVYRILEALQKLGLAEKIVATPTLFKAIPIKEGTSILIERRRVKTLALEKESKRLFSQLSQLPDEMLDDSEKFVLIPKGEVLVRRVEETIKATQKTIRVITPWNESVQWISSLQESWMQALQRNVTVHWITEKPQTVEPKASPVDAVFSHPNFEVRTLSKPIQKRLGIYDSKQALVATNKHTKAGESPTLWTNNAAIVYVLKDYFEMKWEAATRFEKGMK